jgi:putative membrane protein
MNQIDPRIIFAAERTMLSWIRTGIAMMGFGFVVAKFGLFLKVYMGVEDGHRILGNPQSSLWIGVILVILGVVVNILSGVIYNQNVKRIMKNENIEVKTWPLARVLSISLSLIGAVMAVYLVVIS